MVLNTFEDSGVNFQYLSSLIPLKIYPNGDLCKQDIMKENKRKAGIYRWVNNINSKRRERESEESIINIVKI